MWDIADGELVRFNIMNTDGYTVVDNHPITPFQYNGVTFDLSNFSYPFNGNGNTHQGNIILTVGNNDGALNNDVDNRLNLQIGANSGDSFTVELTDATTTALGLDNIDLSTRQGAESAISKIDEAIAHVSSERGKIGAYQNRLDHAYNSVTNTSENLQSADSRIRDTDMAKEMMAYTKNNILTQAAQAMIAQSNKQPETVLQLLQ